MILSSIILTALLSVASSSWLQMWVFLEMNLYFFLFLLSKDKQTSQESLMLYFLVQSASSVALLASVILFSNVSSSWLIQPHHLFFIAMLIKLGAAPFHSWVVAMSPSVSAPSLSCMLTIQKIIPTSIVCMMNPHYLLILSSIAGSLFSSIMSNKSSNLKAIMGVSSINNMGWMTAALSMSITISLYFLLFYSIVVFMTLASMHSSNQKSISHQNKNIISILILSLSLVGMPPLLGFFPKMWIITAMHYYTMPSPLPAMLVISSCFMAMAYMMMTIPAIMSKTLLKPHQMEVKTLINLLPILGIFLIN